MYSSALLGVLVWNVLKYQELQFHYENKYSHPKFTVACLVFGFKFVGMNVNEREWRAKNSSFGQIMVRVNSQKIESWQF